MNGESNGSAAGPDVKWLIDGHVHFHTCFQWPAFLNAAQSNFSHAAATAMECSRFVGILLMTESHGARAFERLGDGPDSIGGWQIRRTAEDESLLLEQPSGPQLVVIAGRQIVTREQLEVLALASLDEFSEGLPIEQALGEVDNRGALPVVPWGFGKWCGKRGRIVKGLIESVRVPRFFVGDNGGRPRASREPALFSFAERHGRHVLPGSDPLPFASQARRVGRYGFVLSGLADMSRPAAQIRSVLRNLTASPARVGEREGLVQFASSQIRMQLRNRRKETVR